jgi:hypothetical protein
MFDGWLLVGWRHWGGAAVDWSVRLVCFPRFGTPPFSMFDIYNKRIALFNCAHSCRLARKMMHTVRSLVHTHLCTLTCAHSCRLVCIIVCTLTCAYLCTLSCFTFAHSLVHTRADLRAQWCTQCTHLCSLMHTHLQYYNAKRVLSIRARLFIKARLHAPAPFPKLSRAVAAVSTDKFILASVELRMRTWSYLFPKFSSIMHRVGQKYI